MKKFGFDFPWRMIGIVVALVGISTFTIDLYFGLRNGWAISTVPPAIAEKYPFMTYRTWYLYIEALLALMGCTLFLLSWIKNPFERMGHWLSANIKEGFCLEAKSLAPTT